MNMREVLAALLMLPDDDRRKIVEIVAAMDGMLEDKPAAIHKPTKRKVLGSNGQKPYTHKERMWLHDHFLNNSGDTEKAISDAMILLGRSHDAILRKWEDFARGRSDIGTWSDWVKGGK